MGHHLFATSCRGSAVFMIYILLYSVELCKCSYIIFDLLEKFWGFLIDITNLEMHLFTQLLNSIVEIHVLVSLGNYLSCYTLHWEVTPSPNTSSPNCLPQMSSVCATCVYALYTSHYFFLSCTLICSCICYICLVNDFASLLHFSSIDKFTKSATPFWGSITLYFEWSIIYCSVHWTIINKLCLCKYHIPLFVFVSS